MKIINAVWEKRNMGLDVVEIVIEKDDEDNEIRDKLKKINMDYAVVKVPSEHRNISFLLEELGYVFIETMNHIKHNLELKPLEGNKKVRVENTQFLKMNNNDIKFMYEQIQNGMFKTDRISRDFHFNKKQSAQRYVGWIEDELLRGAQIYKFVFEGNDYGFIGLKKYDENGYCDFINGIYDKYLGKGLSINMTYKVVDFVIKQGGNMIVSDISSSNIVALKSRINNGYKFESCNYIYVKHR